MSLSIVRSNTLLPCDSRENEAYNRQIPNITDGVVMALLAPGRG